MSVIYDDVHHVYTLDGERLPSVTGVLPEQRFFCTPEQLEAARDDGDENHSLIKMYFDTGETGDNPLLISLAEWITENRSMLGDIVAYETPLASKSFKFAGKPDAIFSKAIVDWKRNPGDKKREALQLGGYHRLAFENKLTAKTRRHIIAWYDGKKFKCRNVWDVMAEDVFLALVKKYHIEKEVERWMKKS